MHSQELKFSGKNWTNIISPSEEGIKVWQKKLHWQSIEIENIVNDNPLSLYFEHSLYNYFNLQFASINEVSDLRIFTIHIFFSNRYLITILPEKISFIEKIFNHFENLFQDKINLKTNTSHILNYLVSSIAENNLHVASRLCKDLPTSRELLKHPYHENEKLTQSIENLLLLQESNGINLSQFQKFLGSKNTHQTNQIDIIKEQLNDSNRLITRHLSITKNLYSQLPFLAQIQSYSTLRSLAITAIAFLPAIFLVCLFMLWLSSYTLAIFSLVFLLILEIIIIQYFKYKKWV